jgi:hypothetical protein
MKMTIFHSKLRGPSRNFLLKVEDEVLDGVKDLAGARGVSASQVMRDALREYLATGERFLNAVRHAEAEGLKTPALPPDREWWK